MVGKHININPATIIGNILNITPTFWEINRYCSTKSEATAVKTILNLCGILNILASIATIINSATGNKVKPFNAEPKESDNAKQ